MYAPSLTTQESVNSDSLDIKSEHLLSIDRLSNPSSLSDPPNKSSSSAPQIYRAAGLRPPSHPPTAKDWELYRDVILQTYKSASSVKELKSILTERYGFRASEHSYRKRILEPAGVVAPDEKSNSQAVVKSRAVKNAAVRKPSKSKQQKNLLEETLKAWRTVGATDGQTSPNSMSLYRKNMAKQAQWDEEKLNMFFLRAVNSKLSRPLEAPGDAQNLYLALTEIEKYYDNFFTGEKYSPENLQREFAEMQVSKQPRTPPQLDPLICLLNDYNSAILFAQQQKYSDARLAVESISERTKHALRNQGPHLLIYLVIMICDSDCPAEFIFNNYLNRYLVDLCKIVVGESHPITVILWNILIAESKIGVGENLVKKSLEIFKKVFGVAHGETFLLMISITNILWQQKRYNEAERFLLDCLNLSVPLLGGADFYSCHARYSLCYCYALMPDWDKVKAAIHDIFTFCEVGTMYELGCVLLEAVADLFREHEDYEYAAYLLSKVAVESAALRGEDHIFTKTMRSNLKDLERLKFEKAMAKPQPSFLPIDGNQAYYKDFNPQSVSIPSQSTSPPSQVVFTPPESDGMPSQHSPTIYSTT
ncbi:MAG: hypothetical protein Q9227_008669 [Pyrenula ochraceoflavens]